MNILKQRSDIIRALERDIDREVNSILQSYLRWVEKGNSLRLSQLKVVEKALQLPLSPRIEIPRQPIPVRPPLPKRPGRLT